MEILHFLQVLGLGLGIFLLFMVWRVLCAFWIWPNKAYQKLRRNGFGGPNPSFPLGNIRDMTKKNNTTNPASPSSSSNITHDIHSTVFPYFAKWQKSHGKSSTTLIWMTLCVCVYTLNIHKFFSLHKFLLPIVYIFKMQAHETKIQQFYISRKCTQKIP